MTMSLQRNRDKPDAERVRDFQRKIYRKAKQEPSFRFYLLYDKVRLLHFLGEAYRRVKANRGSPGVDGMTFEDIEKDLLGFLLDIQEDLEKRTYRPKPVKRVLIPKANGKMRPLGIPTIRDRIVQMSCKMVIEPIFEADFEDGSYGFRPKRSAKQAVVKIKEKLVQGKTEVYDADLSSYFDTIPHEKLMKLIAMRISDRKILHLIKLWLKAPVKEDGKMGGGKKNKKGTPQGGVISPLLANIYLHLVDKIVKKHDAFRGMSLVRYADDFVIMGEKITSRALMMLRKLLERMELSINEEKTRLINAESDSFDFLGFTFRLDRSLYNKDRRYWNVLPSKKAYQQVVSKIREVLIPCRQKAPIYAVRKLNPILRGWLNYFTIDGVSYTGNTRRKLRIYLRDRLFRHQKRKSQRYRYARCRGTMKAWFNKYNLVDPETYGVAAPVKA